MKENYLDLITTLCSINDEEQMLNFLEDLCTHQELDQLNRRLIAAKMLLERATYEEIIEKTKVSSATLARISKCIKQGANGYKKSITK